MARQSWLDDTAQHTMIDDYAVKVEGYLEAMADGRIDPHELEDQEGRVVALMKEIEPKLDDEMHAKITRLLCELSAFNVMQTLGELQQANAQANAASGRWRP